MLSTLFFAGLYASPGLTLDRLAGELESCIKLFPRSVWVNACGRYRKTPEAAAKCVERARMVQATKCWNEFLVELTTPDGPRYAGHFSRGAQDAVTLGIQCLHRAADDHFMSVACPRIGSIELKR